MTSYYLEWDSGTGNGGSQVWSDLVGKTSSYLSTSYIVTSGITPGGTYAVRVSAYNAHGVGLASPLLTIIADAAPDQMAAPTSAIDSLVDVKITWAAADANSAPLDRYKVEIYAHDGINFAESVATCPGSTAQTYCSIPLSTLWAAPFNLV